jgi:hypothetical protein
MRQLSAIEAISPAWHHTRGLFASRKWSTLLKIGFIAAVANASSFNFNTRGFGKSHLPGITPPMATMLVLVAVLTAIVGLVIALVIFYLASRLQFVVFEIVLRRDTIIAPMWRRYGRATWYWMALKLLFFLLACLCVVPFLLPSILHFIHNLPSLATPDPHHLWPFFKTIFSLLIPILIAAFVVSLFYRLLYDFGLPSMALEGTSLGETVARVFRLIRSDPGQVVLYLLLYILLGLAGGLAYFLLLAIAMLIAAIPLGGLGVGLWFGLHHAGIAGHIVMGLGFAVIAFAAFAILVLVILTLVAYLYCFLQAYALYFLGGRYPLLGEYLEPTPPPYIPPTLEPAVDSSAINPVI